MLLLSNLRLNVGADTSDLRQYAAKALGVPVEDIQSLTLTRQSIDARKKSDIHLVCSVKIALRDEQAIHPITPQQVKPLEEHPYHPPVPCRSFPIPPVVVGTGPAGLFAALTLARAGLSPIVLERGRDVDTRTADVSKFWQTGQLTPNSNVQFGEGGAGTFSDGKLTTGTHDPRISHVLSTFVTHGAPPDIQWVQKPHIGTDVLRAVVKSIRRELLSLGAQVRFEHRLEGLTTRNGALAAVTVSAQGGTYQLPCQALVLAPGHSARDTFQMLLEAGVPLERKNFAVGVRLEHDQERISRAQYGAFWDKLPAADYKLACHLPGGRSVFTFCVCPGGQVVAAASAAGEVVTNGMSCRARDGRNINGGVLVEVSPADFDGTDPLAGVRFQQRWERAAFERGMAAERPYFAPAQLVGDFLSGRPSRGAGSIQPSYRPGVVWGSLEGVLPGYVLAAVREALPLFDRKLRGFQDPDGVLTGVETRSSSPVRVVRDESLQSTGLRGLYPCGEGAGYAGGIMSAAVDGIRTAEAILQRQP